MINSISSSNSTGLYEYLISEYDTPLEILNLCQSGLSLIISILIFIKVFDFSGMLSSVKQARIKKSKEKEKREMDRLRVLFERLNNTKIDLKLSETEDDDDENQNDSGVLKIARKKKKNYQQ